MYINRLNNGRACWKILRSYRYRSICIPIVIVIAGSRTHFNQPVSKEETCMLIY